MPDRKKVINGLEHCIGDECSGDKWGKCEYSGHGCIDALLEDALALLKAQEPRVIQYDEIDNYDVLWLEVRDVESEEGLAPWVKTRSGNWFSPLICSVIRPDMILSTQEEYGKMCRCWTSRPTDEQREAEPWRL